MSPTQRPLWRCSPAPSSGPIPRPEGCRGRRKRWEQAGDKEAERALRDALKIDPSRYSPQSLYPGELRTGDGGAVMREFGVGTALLSLTAALVILQTRVEVERGKDGKLSWKIEKQAADSAVLKALIEKVLGFLPGK